MKINNRHSLLALSLFLIGTLSSCAVVFSSYPEEKLQRLSESPFDVIIVPGVPLENGKWSPIMKARVLWAYYLYSRSITKNIIFSGAAVYTPFVESKVMGMYAEALGVPHNNIFFETKAEHSAENLYYSYKLAQKEGFRRIALATDPIQSYTLKAFFTNEFHFRIAYIPVDFDVIKKMDVQTPSIDLKQAFVKDFKSITLRKNFYQRLLGTMGKLIERD